MADDRSVRGRRRTWILLLGVLLAAGAAFWIARRPAPDGADAPGTPASQAAEGSGDTAEPVRDFTEWAATTRSAAADAPLEPDAIAEGLRRLAGALGARGTDRPELLVDLRVAAEHVVLNPTSPDVAATVRDTLIAAAAAIPAPPAASGPTPQAAAEGIKPDAPLTTQPAAIRTFFQAAADALAGA